MPSRTLERAAATPLHRDAKRTAAGSVAVTGEEAAKSYEPKAGIVATGVARVGSQPTVPPRLSPPIPERDKPRPNRKLTPDQGGAVAVAAEISPAPEGIRRIPQDDALLRRRWRALLGRRAPQTLSHALLDRILAWREQVAEVSDISPRSRAILAAALAGNAATGASGGGARDGEDRQNDDVPRPQPHAPIRVGTVFVREHADVLHRVTVVVDGFEWEGQTYASLSAVARAITGVRWNGRRFFALDRDEKRPAMRKADGQDKEVAGQDLGPRRAKLRSNGASSARGGT